MKVFTLRKRVCPDNKGRLTKEATDLIERDYRYQQQKKVGRDIIRKGVVTLCSVILKGRERFAEEEGRKRKGGGGSFWQRLGAGRKIF